jgi:hypothetical protein
VNRTESLTASLRFVLGNPDTPKEPHQGTVLTQPKEAKLTIHETAYDIVSVLPVTRSVRLRSADFPYLPKISSVSISCFITARRESSSDLVRRETSPLP